MECFGEPSNLLAEVDKLYNAASQGEGRQWIHSVIQAPAVSGNYRGDSNAHAGPIVVEDITHGRSSATTHWSCGVGA